MKRLIYKPNTQRGITLVALIVTIIILVILAAVSVMIVTQYGIMESAEEASAKYTEAQVNELQQTKELSDKFESIISKLEENDN